MSFQQTSKKFIPENKKIFSPYFPLLGKLITTTWWAVHLLTFLFVACNLWPRWKRTKSLPKKRGKKKKCHTKMKNYFFLCSGLKEQSEGNFSLEKGKQYKSTKNGIFLSVWILNPVIQNRENYERTTWALITFKQ